LILPAEQQATMLAEKRMDETYIKIQRAIVFSLLCSG
jgi:hypothetical protein